jgi:competence protein ComEC
VVVCALGAAAGLPPAWLAPPEAVADGAARAILAIAHLFATLPGAVRTLPSAPEPALLLSFIAIVFAALWRGRLRWPAAALSTAVLLWPRPDLPLAWVAADGDNAAVVADGRPVVLKPDVRAFSVNAWESREGLAPPFDPQAEADLAFSCDRMGCLPKAGPRPAIGAWWGRRAVPPERLAALCQASDIAVVRGPPPPATACPGALLLTRDDFERGGSMEVYPGVTGWRLVWANDLRGERPWTRPLVLPAPSPRSAACPSPHGGEGEVATCPLSPPGRGSGEGNASTHAPRTLAAFAACPSPQGGAGEVATCPLSLRGEGRGEGNALLSGSGG